MNEKEFSEVLHEKQTVSASSPSVQSTERHHSHEHSHSHQHHHRHHRTKKEKAKRFWKKYGKIVKIGAVILAVAMFMVMAVLADRRYSRAMEETLTPSTTEPTDFSEGYLYVGIPSFASSVSLSNTVVGQYMQADSGVEVGDIVGRETTLSDNRFDWPASVKLSFDVLKTPEAVSVLSAKVELSEGQDFTQARVYPLDSAYAAEIVNLKTNVTYYYRATFALSDGSAPQYRGSFKTAQGPRLLKIDGIYNVRDIGGWSTAYGKSIRQGLLFRGTELDGAVEGKYKLTQDGINELVMQLGVKYDMDFRVPTDSVEGIYILGQNVQHKYYSIGQYADIFSKANKPRVRAVFSDLANPANYPLYMHCTYGCDRTGTICYLLEALLGVNQEDLVREYELSGLSSNQIDRQQILAVHTELQKYAGNTLAEKTEDFLRSCGVTQTEIDSIRTILLEK